MRLRSLICFHISHVHICNRLLLPLWKKKEPCIPPLGLKVRSGRILSHPSLSRHDSEVCYVCRHMLLKETYSFALVENRTHGPSNNCAVLFKIYAGPINTPPTETRTGEPLGAKPLSRTGTHTATLPKGHKCTSSDCRRSTRVPSFQLLNAESDSSFSRLVSFELRITHRWPCYTEQWSVSQSVSPLSPLTPQVTH